jgi:solute:Na+ symporter, SSS family
MRAAGHAEQPPPQIGARRGSGRLAPAGAMTRFGWLDLAVVVTYLGVALAIGLRLGRRQKDARDYFVAGRDIPWWAVMLSVVATETSALTFISIPGYAYNGDLGFLQIAAGYVLGRFGVAWLLLPRYFEGELVTAYTLLERRFGSATRKLTSIVFMATRALADSVRVFATAIPVAMIIGPVLPERMRAHLMPVAVLVLGAITLLYTWRGGMRAVVWTELLQAAIYITGGLSAAWLLASDLPGGWPAILERAAEAGKLAAVDWSFDLSKPYTIWSGLIGGAFLSMASHGADQLIVQRLLSSRSLRDAQRAIVGSGLVVFLQFTLFLTVGLGLWAWFGERSFDSSDQVFATFIVERMPRGLLGLIVAAVIAATMSTHSGAINSLAATTTHDIYLPLTGRSPEDPRALRAGRIFALCWGVVLTLGALLFEEGRTPVVEVALSIASFTTGALLGGFFLGLFVRRAIQRDAILALCVGLTTMTIVGLSKRLLAIFPAGAPLLEPLAAIAWPWYALIGTSVTVATGWLSSRLRAS